MCSKIEFYFYSQFTRLAKRNTRSIRFSRPDVCFSLGLSLWMYYPLEIAPVQYSCEALMDAGFNVSLILIYFDKELEIHRRYRRPSGDTGCDIFTGVLPISSHKNLNLATWEGCHRARRSEPEEGDAKLFWMGYFSCVWCKLGKVE